MCYYYAVQQQVSIQKGQVMDTIPTITEQDIHNIIDATSFQRGQSYYRGNAIFNTRREGMTLKARCQGSRSQAYRVEVKFDTDGIVSNQCSCPLGGHCKHVVALLLTWVHDPQEFLEQPEVDELLEQSTKAELISLIKKMLRREPELESLLQTAGKQNAAANPEIYRRQVNNAFQHSSYDWDDTYEVGDELSSVKETADEFAGQGDYASAVTVYESIINGIIDNFYSYEDEEGELGSVINDCVEELDTCLANVQDDKALREHIMQVLFAAYNFDVKAGGIGVGEEAPDILLKHATPDERRMIAGWVRQEIARPDSSGWGTRFRDQWYGGFLLELEADELDDEAFLRICRETGRIGDAVDRLLTLGRLDEAIRDAEKEGDYDLMALADIFVQHGHHTEAEKMIRQRSKTSDDTRLLDWLKRFYLSRNDKAAGLDLAVELFYKQPPVLAYYQEIRLLAKVLGRWETIRPELLAYLKKTQNNYLLIQIALDEGDIVEALVLLKTSQARSSATAYGGLNFYGYSGIEIEVAKAAEATLPRESIEIYQKHVERLIGQRGRGSYQQACQYLLKVRDLYKKLGEDEKWTGYLTNLRDKNRMLRALKEELQKAGLV